MSLETATYIDGLVVTNPAGGDLKSTGDDHMRLIKSTIKNTFPNISGAVLPTHTELNYVDGVTSAIQTQLDAKSAISSGSFTITFGGGEFSSPLSGTVFYKVSGKICTLYITSDITGTSASTAMTATGLPSAIWPNSVANYISSGRYKDNSVEVSAQVALTPAGSGLFTFAMSVISGNRITRDTAAFTIGGTKGLLSGWTVTYAIQ